MRNDRYDDEDPAMRDERGAVPGVTPEGTLDTPEDSTLSPEAASQGRDVHDLTRQGVSRGRDTVEPSDPETTESHGRDVIDRGRHVEVKGVDVLDLGPIDPEAPIRE